MPSETARTATISAPLHSTSDQEFLAPRPSVSPISPARELADLAVLAATTTEFLAPRTTTYHYHQQSASPRRLCLAMLLRHLNILCNLSNEFNWTQSCGRSVKVPRTPEAPSKIQQVCQSRLRSTDHQWIMTSFAHTRNKKPMGPQ